jgi:hypothetical protein
MKNFFKRSLSFFIHHQYRWYIQFGIFLIACLITILRRIDIISYPQFWAEDGTVWYEDAYNLGVIQPFFIPVAGYLQTVSRLVGLISQIIPLVYAPLFFNVVAIGIKAVPVYLLFSTRFSKIIPSLKTKFLLAFLYVSLPNTQEVFANVTNAQWFLALSAFMILVGESVYTKKEKIFDSVILILSGLSGPFVLFLLPILILKWKDRKAEKYFKYLSSIVVICALVQGMVVFSGGLNVRSHKPLEATPAMLVKITAGQVYLASLIGKEGYAELYNHILNQDRLLSKFITLVIFIAGSLMVGYAVFKGSQELRLFIIFCALLFFAALSKPMGANWFVLMLPGSAARYWLFPMLGFIVSLVWLLSRQNVFYIRIIGGVILLISLVGVKNEWVYKQWSNLDFKNQVIQFEQAPLGREFEFKIMPRSWHTMKLVKHSL